MKKKIIIFKSGNTSDGKDVYSGIFKFYETFGLPLEIIIESMKKNNSVIDALDFVKSAMKSGMKERKVLSMLEEALTEVFSQDYWKSWLRNYQYCKSILDNSSPKS